MNAKDTVTHSSPLADAVCAVMEKVQRLAKGDLNTFGSTYKYTSVDDMKDGLRPLLAANGLDVRISETDWSLENLPNSKGGSTVCARFTFEIWLRHISGEEDKPDRTTVMLPHTGAQTTGAAKSYAIKEWLKGRFLVSTGELEADADSHKQENYETSKPVPPKPAPKPAAKALEDFLPAPAGYKAFNPDIFATLEAEVRTLRDAEDASIWKLQRKPELDALDKESRQKLRDLYKARSEEIKEKETENGV